MQQSLRKLVEELILKPLLPLLVFLYRVTGGRKDKNSGRGWCKLLHKSMRGFSNVLVEHFLS